jgi:hypothetical protein
MLKTLFKPTNPLTLADFMDAIERSVSRSNAIITSITINFEDDQRSVPSNETVLNLVDAIQNQLEQIQLLADAYWAEVNKKSN